MSPPFLNPKIGYFSEPARAWPLGQTDALTFLFKLSKSLDGSLSYKEIVQLFVESCENSWKSQGRLESWTADEIVYSACSVLVFDIYFRQRTGCWECMFDLLKTRDLAFEEQVLDYLLFFKKLFPLEFSVALLSYFDRFDGGRNDYRNHPELVDRLFLPDWALRDLIFLSVGFQESYLTFFNEIKRSKVFTILKKHLKRRELQELNLECFLRLENPVHCQSMVAFLQTSGIFQTLDEEFEKKLETFRENEFFPCFIQLKFNTIFVPSSLNTRNVQDMRDFILTLTKKQRDLIGETIENQKRRGLASLENKPVLEVVSTKIVELAAPLVLSGVLLALSSSRMPPAPPLPPPVVYVTQRGASKVREVGRLRKAEEGTGLDRENIRKVVIAYQEALKERWQITTGMGDSLLVPELRNAPTQASEEVTPFFTVKGDNVENELAKLESFDRLRGGGSNQNVYTAKSLYKDPLRGFYVSPQKQRYPALIVTRVTDDKRLLVLEGLQQSHSRNISVCKVLNASPIPEIQLDGFTEPVSFDEIGKVQSDHLLNEFDGCAQQVRSSKDYNCNCPAVTLVSKTFHQSGNRLSMWECNPFLYEQRVTLSELIDYFSQIRNDYITKVSKENPNLLLLEPDEYKAAYSNGFKQLETRYQDFHRHALLTPTDALFYYTANRLNGNIRETQASLTNSSDRLDLTNSTPTTDENIRTGEWSSLESIGAKKILEAMRFTRGIANSFPLNVNGTSCREILCSCPQNYDGLEAALLIFSGRPNIATRNCIKLYPKSLHRLDIEI